MAKNCVILAAKRIRKELILQAAPELIEVATKRKSPKHALKSPGKKNKQKQLGGGRRSRKIYPEITIALKRITRRVIPRKRTAQRSRSDFFTEKGFKMISNLSPSEATHSSLRLFEKPPLLVTFTLKTHSPSWTLLLS